MTSKKNTVANSTSHRLSIISDALEEVCSEGNHKKPEIEILANHPRLNAPYIQG